MSVSRVTVTMAPAFATVAIFVAWAYHQAGYQASQWAPGGLMVLGLLGISVGVLGRKVSDVPPLIRLALGSFAAYTAFSFLSVLWAAAPADAFEGANRTLLYLLVFTLFASWPQRADDAALLLGTWVLAMVALAAYVLLRLDTATAAGLPELMPEGRLSFPSGYFNANAAQWLMAFWPAVLLARSGRVPWAARGLLAGGAVLLAETALLSQSRGSLVAMAVMLVLVFVLLRERTRTFALMVPVALGIGAAAPAVLAVGDHLNRGTVSAVYVHRATAVTLVAAVAVGLLVAIAAVIETRNALSESAVGHIRRGLGLAALATLLTIAVAAVVAVGAPVTRIQHSWESFKDSPPADSTGGSHLANGLESTRYDYYRVALDEFVAHPLIGIGVDNFQQQYLRHRHGTDAPRYPHSIELSTLTYTGLIGALLGAVGLGAALLVGASAVRSTPGADPLASAVAAAALAGFTYWLIHGSVDWFWEIAGLGAPAFALLGLACALAPRAGGDPDAVTLDAQSPAAALSARRSLGIGTLMLLALASAGSLAAQWMR
ncbi:MAG TPA: O-antigen ligase family protein [Solirubrobacteraceae bacterium]|nr:O-antigen ligase family protein [Solirubrobacteraceae bacterium]